MTGLKFRRPQSIQERLVISICTFVEKVICSKVLATYLRDLVSKMFVLYYGKGEDGSPHHDMIMHGNKGEASEMGEIVITLIYINSVI